MNWGAPTLLALGLSMMGQAATTDCLSCHQDQGTSAKASVHGSLSCTQCHSTIHEYPHPQQVTRVNCASCHDGSAHDIAASVHASVGAQPCLNCHGPAHSILPASDPKSSVYAMNLPHTCGECHGNAQIAKQAGLKEVYSLYLDSIHGRALTKNGLLVAANCSSCHGSHKILSSKNKASRTNYANVPATCGTCHAGPLKSYTAGIHGQMLEAGVDSAPVCTSCHTAHQISSVETTSWQMKTTATCGGCHKDELITYHDTFHAQVSALGYVEVARCWDCHGEHEILPASDPKSTIAASNRAATCAKCHTGASASFATYDPHADSHDVKHYPALHYSAIFMNLLLAGVLGFFALHTFLWFIRSRFGTKGGSHE
jgi:predicted CXXCH cytochrome family protein